MNSRFQLGSYVLSLFDSDGKKYLPTILIGLILLILIPNCSLDPIPAPTIEEEIPPTVCYTIESVTNDTVAPSTFQISATCSENASSYKWDIGNDGTIEYSTETISHTFEEPGTYSIKLNVENSEGTSEEISFEVQLKIPTFSVSYGGDESESPAAAIQLSDGSYVMVGHGENRIYRLNEKNGNVLASFGLPQGKAAFWLEDVIESPQGDIIVCGFEQSGQPLLSYGVITKFDSSLNLITQLETEKKTNFIEMNWFFSIVLKTTGSYELLGTSSGRPFLVSVSPTFNQAPPANAYTYFTEYGGAFRPLLHTKDGKLLFFARNNNDQESYLIKTSESAPSSFEWTKEIDFSIGNIVEGSNGNYAIAGQSNGQPYFMEMNPSSTVVFEGAIASRAGSFSDLDPLESGYALCGTATSNTKGGDDLLMVILDDNFQLIHEETFGDEFDQTGSTIIQTHDGGFFMTGSTRNPNNASQDYYFVKTDSEGRL